MEFSGCNAHYEGRQFDVLPESLQRSEWPPIAVDTVFSELFSRFISTNPRELMLAGLRVEAVSTFHAARPSIRLQAAIAPRQLTIWISALTIRSSLVRVVSCGIRSIGSTSATRSARSGRTRRCESTAASPGPAPSNFPTLSTGKARFFSTPRRYVWGSSFSSR